MKDLHRELKRLGVKSSIAIIQGRAQVETKQTKVKPEFETSKARAYRVALKRALDTFRTEHRP